MRSRTSLFIMLILLLGFISVSVRYNPVVAQSRTEDAKDRLDGKGGIDVANAVRFMMYFGGDAIPYFLYFGPLYEHPPEMGYNRYPYETPYFQGIRNFESGQRGLWDVQATFSLPQTYEAMLQASAEVKRNMRFWSYLTSYEYLRERAAPYPIHQMRLAVERKFRFMPQGDGGLQFGVRTLGLDGDFYAGPEFAVNMEVYPWRPFSLAYTGSYTYTTFADVVNHQATLGIHMRSSRVFFRYRWLDIGGIWFRTLTAGTGFYF